MTASSDSRRGWMIRKANGGAPFDGTMASIIGPDTEPVEVVPAKRVTELAAELEARLADAPIEELAFQLYHRDAVFPDFKREGMVRHRWAGAHESVRESYRVAARKYADVLLADCRAVLGRLTGAGRQA